MFNDMMTYPFRPWGESLDESEKMSASLKLAEETGYPVDKTQAAKCTLETVEDGQQALQRTAQSWDK